MLFPLIKAETTDETLAPKITGMLIDFEVILYWLKIHRYLKLVILSTYWIHRSN